MEPYARVRRAVVVDKMSEREAARQFGLARETVRKMLRYAVPPGYRRQEAARRPKLDAWTAVIDRILEDGQARHKKQRHTSKRIFERLRDEHAYSGGYTIVKDYVRLRKLSQREMFVPLEHPPGDGQADFGEALVRIGGEERKAHYLVVDLPQSDDCFVMAFRRRKRFWKATIGPLPISAACRARCCTTTPSLRWRAFWAMARAQQREPSANSRVAICSPTSSDVRVRARTKARWKDWWATRGATSWCRCRPAPKTRITFRRVTMMESFKTRTQLSARPLNESAAAHRYRRRLPPNAFQPPRSAPPPTGSHTCAWRASKRSLLRSWARNC